MINTTENIKEGNEDIREVIIIDTELLQAVCFIDRKVNGDARVDCLL